MAGTTWRGDAGCGSDNPTSLRAAAHCRCAWLRSGSVSNSDSAKRDADERYVRRLAQLIDPDGFPSITAAMVSGSLQDESDFAEDEFRFGLSTVLDGIEALIGRRTAATP
jgi:hypothetical protein